MCYQPSQAGHRGWRAWQPPRRRASVRRTRRKAAAPQRRDPASITTTLDLYGHLYPGEMDRYADRLDEAATNGDAAKMRPNDGEDEDDEE